MTQANLATDFEDTRGFTATRWSTATKLFSLSKADQGLVGEIKTHKAFDNYLKDAAGSAATASQLTAIQSIMQIHRPLWKFEDLIERSVEGEDVDTSSIWAMTYLNVKVRNVICQTSIAGSIG
jgi:hypothetical protein